MKIFQKINPEIYLICRAIFQQGGTALLVGGCVRDELMHVIHGIDKPKSKDIDIEVFGLPQHVLETLLKSFGKIDLVGESFAVTKLTTKNGDYDFSLPRREVKSGEGHTGFIVTADPYMSVYEAASRRDITINAIYYNPLDSIIQDPFNGIVDIEDKLIHHVSERFAEDPLRVLRIMQFCGRFGYSVHNSTILMSQELLKKPITLSKERVGDEFNKLFIKGIEATSALSFLRNCRWTSKFPELHKIEVGQHWEETYDLCDYLLRDNVRFQRTDFERQTLGLAGLCFHMKNPESFLKQINAPNHIKKVVINLVDVGQQIVWVYDNEEEPIVETKKAIEKLDVGLRELFNAFMASFSHFCWTQQHKFLLINACISDESITARVTGDDLIKLGWTQGRELGLELKRLFNLQLEQNISKEELLETVEKNPICINDVVFPKEGQKMQSYYGSVVRRDGEKYVVAFGTDRNMVEHIYNREDLIKPYR